MLADGAAPLHLAVHNGVLKTVEGMVQRRADVSLKDNQHGIQPMEVAEMAGHREIAEFLVRMRAAVGDRNHIPQPKDEIAGQGELQVLEYLFQHGLLKPEDVLSLMQGREKAEGERLADDTQSDIPASSMSTVSNHFLFTLGAFSAIGVLCLMLGSALWGSRLIVMVLHKRRDVRNAAYPLLPNPKVGRLT